MIQRETSTTDSRTHRSPKGPVRTCVGCRKRELAVELLRVVAVSGNGNEAVTIDRAGTQPGRGAWLHPASECLHAAIRRRAFAHALRISGSPDVSGVEEYFDHQIGSPPRPTEQVAKNMSTP